MYFLFNPADIQATGIGIAAFLSTTLAVYVFLSARKERLGLTILYTMLACTLWSWFGFFYHLIPDLPLARAMRVISVMGIVGINITEINFALAYLSERVRPTEALYVLRHLVLAGGAALLALLCADLFGSGFIVGPLTAPPSQVLAPEAGPLMIVLVDFYMFCTATAGMLLAWRARAAVDEIDRRQALWLFASMTIGLTLGGTRFTPWFGFDFYPLVGDIGFPLFAFSALYTMQKYRLLNREIAVAQVLIFTIWTLSFFSILLDRSVGTAIPDAVIFVAAVILGIVLMRSVIQEAATQRTLARLTLERGKSEFATIAAHQLRTPITAVRWAFEGLKASTLTHDQLALVQKGWRAADQMSSLASDLLDVDRIDMGAFGYAKEPGDLRDAIKVAVSISSDLAADRGVVIATDLPDTPLMAQYDRGKMALVLENLINNATKYTPKSGHVSISARREGSRIVLHVRDTGIGISREDAAHLFEKFYRSKEARLAAPDGSGLGLYIVKTIIDGHNGEIRFDSEGPGMGSDVTVELPAAA